MAAGGVGSGPCRAICRWRALTLLVTVLLVLPACFAPKADVTVRNWRPLGQAGPSLGQALQASPGRRNVVFETYAGEAGNALVRLSVEYDPAAAVACPEVPAGMARAARAFLLLECTVSPQGRVEPVKAMAQIYSAKGYYEEYALDMRVVADLVTGTFPLPCADLVLPDYL